MMKNNMNQEISGADKVTIAYMHFVRGIQQQDLAAQYIVNSGRISEICRSVGHALGITPPGYLDKSQLELLVSQREEADAKTDEGATISSLVVSDKNGTPCVPKGTTIS